MRPETRAWINKAEGDFVSLQREFAVSENPNYDLVCFLAQQCAEKYLKALLVELATPFPYSHDLIKINALLPPSQQYISHHISGLARLSLGAVEFRYAGSDADYPIESDAVKEYVAVRTHCRKLLTLN